MAKVVRPLTSGCYYLAQFWLVDNGNQFVYGYPTMNERLIVTNAPTPTSPVAWAAGG